MSGNYCHHQNVFLNATYTRPSSDRSLVILFNEKCSEKLMTRVPGLFAHLSRMIYANAMNVLWSSFTISWLAVMLPENKGRSCSCLTPWRNTYLIRHLIIK